MGIHDGHRERMKKRFMAAGLDGFDDLNVLELLLFYAIPRGDTNVIAHALLDRFGSLGGVLEATIPELTAVKGIGENSAALLRLIPQVSRRYMMTNRGSGVLLTSSRIAGQYCISLFMYEKEEVLYLICLDSKREMLSCEEMERGTVNATKVSARRIVERALAHRATSVILAHNHISGIAVPSREDEVSTQKIQAALELLGVKLADHIVVAGQDFISMADSGMLYRG